jgi:hypothetical protein
MISAVTANGDYNLGKKYVSDKCKRRAEIGEFPYTQNCLSSLIEITQLLLSQSW